MAERLRARRRDLYEAESGPVFATSVGTVLSPSSVRSRVLIPAAQPVGLGWIGFHTFRHTCASLLFEPGKDVKQVQEWLGHSDPGFTLRTYVHLMDEGLGEADFLDAAVGHNATAGPDGGEHEVNTTPGDSRKALRGGTP
jgi:integrase